MADLNQAYTWAINTCNAPNVGYSSDSYLREGITQDGITYYDCSSFIYFALKNAGFPVPSTCWYTGSMMSGLTAAGWHQENIQGEWLPGDIILRRSGDSGHTEMVYTGGTGQGITMGAHQAGVPLDREVSINTYLSYASNYQTLWRYGAGDATKVGINIYVAAAICGNWWEESTLNPARWQGDNTQSDYHVIGHGYGLGQWTNVLNDPDGRLWQLYQYIVVDHAGSMTSGPLQVDFFIDENYWQETGAATGFATLGDFLNSQSQNLDLLTDAFCEGWEGIPAQTVRRQHAAEILTYLQRYAESDLITEWKIKVPSAALSSADLKNNAVMIYRQLNEIAGGSEWPGGGGGSGNFKSNMPIWMFLRHGYI